jgi:outer membrane receptor protein involved in Fe transport
MFRADGYSLRNAVRLKPTISGGTVTASRSGYDDTGLYGEALLNINDVFFITGAIRGEWNTYFGQDIGVPVSPRVGISYVRPFGAITAKVRVAYGQAIRPPSSVELYGNPPYIIPNPNILPERQVGPDLGLDLVVGNRGSLGITYYYQKAKDLIQQFTVDPTATPQTSQFANIARIRNSGWELEGTMNFRRLTLQGQWGWTSSVAEDLGTYAGGDIIQGEQITGLPHVNAGLSATVTLLRGTTVTGAMAYTGTVKRVDYLAQVACSFGTGPCNNNSTDVIYYINDYKPLATFNLSVDQQLMRHVTGYLSVENVANETDPSRTGITYYPITGRVSIIGLRVKM